jgi:hypothetical protein
VEGIDLIDQLRKEIWFCSDRDGCSHNEIRLIFDRLADFDSILKLYIFKLSRGIFFYGTDTQVNMYHGSSFNLYILDGLNCMVYDILLKCRLIEKRGILNI